VPATTTSTQAPTTTTEPRTFLYAVVAEERSRRIDVIDPAAACQGEGEDCLLAPVLSIELPQRPHNLAAAGSVVYATHTTAGAVSRIDLATGEILTVAVGTEPHDIEYEPEGDVLFVTDEEGRSLLTLDPETLGVLNQVNLPGRPHNLVISGSAVWVTLVGDGRLARVTGDGVEFFPTGGTPHDLIVDTQGEIWFSNWNSNVLNVFHPDIGATVEAPAGVTQPHHFALGPDGSIWVSDNGGSAVVQFTETGTTTIVVGPVPHHMSFIGETVIVAVSGAGEAVLVRDGEVVGRVQLSEGLHGVAIVELAEPLGG
jgi:DNA-binding beta-propeller fold protein YncE